MSFNIEYADVFIISLPVKVPLRLGEGLQVWRQKESTCVKKCIGHLLNIPCRLLITLTGLPLIIYIIAKAILLKSLNFLTCHSISYLKEYSKRTNKFAKIIITSIFKSIFCEIELKALKKVNSIFFGTLIQNTPSVNTTPNKKINQIPTVLIYEVLEFIGFNKVWFIAASVISDWKSEILSHPIMKCISIIQKISQGKEVEVNSPPTYSKKNFSTRVQMARIYGKIDPQYKALKSLLKGETSLLKGKEAQNLLNNELFKYLFVENATLLAEAVKKDPEILELISSQKLKEKIEFICSIPPIVFVVYENLKDDEDIVLALVAKQGYCLYYASDRLKDEKDIVLTAVHRDGEYLQDASDRLKDDKEIVLEAVSTSWEALAHASKRLKDDKDVVLKAVLNNANALRYGSDRLRNDKEIVLTAIRSGGAFLQFAFDDLKDDRDVVLAAVTQYGYAIQYASDRLKNDKEIVLAAMRQYPSAISFAPEELQEELLKVRREAIQNSR